MRGSSVTLPLVLNSHQVELFNFYQGGSIKQGMRYGHDLYVQAYKFEARDRLAAYALAIELGEAGCRIVITVSETSYQLWVRLHTAEYPHWEAMVQGSAAMVAAG